MIIQENIPLIDKNWFRTGGPARYFCSPHTQNKFRDALLFAQQHDLQIFILGHGANVLINDAGFDGLIIQPQLKNISIQEENDQIALVTAQAGCSIAEVIQYCFAHNISGLEEFSGIPGTIGGAAYINLHYFEFLLAHFIVDARIIHKDSGTIEKVSTQWFSYGYNYSTLIHKKQYIIDVTFRLKKISDTECAYARGRSNEIIRHRQKRYPQEGTCGSFFRNFFPHEVLLEKNKQKIIWIAYYLDKIGVKGQLNVGNAYVSHQHANMIVNHHNATTGDIIKLARTMQKLIKKNFDILPHPECQLVGFKENPLLTK